MFPPEILEIVAGFSSADRTTLQAFSLVSSTCLALARKHLFAYITFRPPNSHASPCSALLAIIDASKRRGCRLGTFTPFVRHLHIQEGSGRTTRWIAADSSLPPVLHALSDLISFRLTCLEPMPVFWAEIPVTLRSAIIRDVLSQSTLVEVGLCGMVFENPNQVHSLLGFCRGLKTLEFCHSGVQQGSTVEVESGGDVEKHTLDTLTLGTFTPILFVRTLLHPTCPIRFKTVRKLCLTVTGNFSDLARVILASTALESLELVLENPSDLEEPSERLNLSKLPSLCNFRIKFDIFQDAGILLKWLTAVLRTGINLHFPTCSNMMKNLTVVLRPYRPSVGLDHLPMQLSEWGNVDAVLCGDGHRNGETPYSNLKRVNLDFILYSKKPVDLRFLENLLDSPGLKERGLLHVNVIDV